MPMRAETTRPMVTIRMISTTISKGFIVDLVLRVAMGVS
jgi:hypothetical protein